MSINRTLSGCPPVCFQGRPLELRILKSQHSPQETLRMRMHP